MNWFWHLFDGLFEGTGWADSLQKEYRNDPVYKRKLQELIDRNRQFEEESNDKRS